MVILKRLDGICRLFARFLRGSQGAGNGQALHRGFFCLTCQGFGVAGCRACRLRGGDDNMLLQVV